LPQGFFRSWHRPLLQADCDISFPSTQLEVPGVAGDQQVLMSVHYKAESAHLQVTYNDQTLEADVNDPLTELLQEHVLQALNDLDMSIDLDDLPANEILSLSFSGAIEDKCVLNDGVQRTHISWTGKRYDDERLDTRSWLAHYVSCSLNEVMTSSALSGHIADGRELLEREVNMDHTELLNLVLEVTEKRFGKYSDKWWHAQSGRDWGLM
jgi:hypothetical protein